jgi:hypothetical protein
MGLLLLFPADGVSGLVVEDLDRPYQGHAGDCRHDGEEAE